MMENQAKILAKLEQASKMPKRLGSGVAIAKPAERQASIEAATEAGEAAGGDSGGSRISMLEEQVFS